MVDNHYKNYLKNAPFGFVHFKILSDNTDYPIDFQYLEVNDAFLKMSGNNLSEIICKTVKEVSSNSGNDEFNWYGIWTEIVLNNFKKEIELWLGNPKHWYKVQAFSLDESHFSAIFSDISEYKTNAAVFEQEIKKMEEFEKKYNMLIETSSNAIYCTNEKGEYWFTNKVFADLFGRTPDYFIGKTFWDVYPKEDADIRHAVNKKVFETGEPQIIEVSIPFLNKTLYFISKVNPVKDESGKVILSLTNATEITDRRLAESALQESEGKYRQLVENSHDIIYTLSCDGVFIFVSKSWTAMLGHKTDEIVGESFQKFVNPEDIPGCMVWLQKIIETGERQDGIEYRVQHKNGEWFWHTSSAVPLKDKSGKIIGFEGTARDITERKRVEKSLLASVSLLNASLESTADGILIIDREGKITKWSQKFAEMWKIPAEVLASNDDSLVINSILMQLTDPDQFINKVKHLYDYPEESSFDSIEFLDGQVFERYSQPHRIGTEIVGRVWSFRDITDRRRAEEIIRNSEQKFRTLFEHMTEGVALNEMIYDQDGIETDYRILDINPAYLKQTGFAFDSVKGQLASDLYKNKPGFLDVFGKVARTGEPVIFETYSPKLDKHFRIISISPKFGFFATVFEDISDRKLKEEELKQKNEELTRFTYTVSHDLKSPLVTIKSFLGFLEQDINKNDSARIKKDINYISNAVKKMSSLLDELLDLSRIGRKMNAYVEAPLQILVNEALDLIAGRINERKVNIKITEVPVQLFGDVHRLVEVFQNLLDNAVKFMGNQPNPLVEIGVEQKGNEIVIFIKDNGIGIDPRHKPKLFGMFEKLNPGTEGTGIGLALVRRIVEVHGGKIWAESEGLGKGTTFLFILANTKFA